MEWLKLYHNPWMMTDTNFGADYRLYIKMDEVTAPEKLSQNILIALLWLVAIKVINPRPLHISEQDMSQNKNSKVHVIYIFLSSSVVLVTLMCVQVFLIILISYLMKRGVAQHG